MATLTLSHTTDVTSSSAAGTHGVRLREWLGGQWAVLFSNPEDFAPHPTTPEGFITLLADDFAACGAKPISLDEGSGEESTPSWLDFAGADASNIVLSDAQTGQIVDLAERTLALKLDRLLCHSPSRFVIVLDEKARCRTTITYNRNSSARNRTIEDVLTVVQVLQRRTPVAPQKQFHRVAVG
jgi:alkyl hydroperoxide reductase subunit AhpC